ncbi:MAG: putative sulfate exporter family transporter, partial [Duodenibacillus sp.]|nr:putative sulfate exporter family transporter [Duodenibacillus sp.]
MLPGLALVASLSAAAFLIAAAPFVRSLSLSPLVVGILVGMLYANTLRRRQPAAWHAGVAFAAKRLLRLGIILYGFRLTFQDVAAVGAGAVALDAVVVTVTIAGGVLLGRAMKMDPGVALLTSVGSGICGAAAVLGAEAVIRAKPWQTAVSVATVVIFGTAAMFLYPVLYRNGVYDLPPGLMGVFTGASVHEVAHVVGAGNAMDPDGALHIADMAT